MGRIYLNKIGKKFKTAEMKQAEQREALINEISSCKVRIQTDPKNADTWQQLLEIYEARLKNED